MSQSNQPKAVEKTNMFTAFCYSFGEVGSQLSWYMISTYLTIFYTDVVTLSAGAISAIMLIARIWDAINDPMMGVIADKTKTETTLREIIDWIRANLGICELSGTVGDSRYHYENVRIRPTQSPSNQGVTSNGLIVKVASAEIYYDQPNQQED